MEHDPSQSGPAADVNEETAPAAGTPLRGVEERVIEPENALPETTLEALPAPLKEACARAGWSKLMPVQARAKRPTTRPPPRKRKR